MTLAQVFSCEFCEILKNTFFNRTPPVAASVVRFLKVIQIITSLFWKTCMNWHMLWKFGHAIRINLNGTLLDLLLTNKPSNFQETKVYETGLSELIATTLRLTFVKLSPKTVKYRSYTNFNETVFLHELDQKLI